MTKEQVLTIHAWLTKENNSLIAYSRYIEADPDESFRKMERRRVRQLGEYLQVQILELRAIAAEMDCED